MYHLSPPRPVAAMSLAEARRIVADADHARQFDDMTRYIAWQMCLAARRGTARPLLLVITSAASCDPQPPKEAA